jgi:hypothetical protein
MSDPGVVMFDVAQICLNGHVINASAGRFPHSNAKFCEACGSQTIVACPACRSPIKGEPKVSWMAADAVPPYRCPSFCTECGAPYPWTETKLKTAGELIGLSDDLAATEKEALIADLPDLVRDNPRTQVAATRFKKIAAKVGGGIASALRDIVVDVSSEAAKKIILGP